MAFDGVRPVLHLPFAAEPDEPIVHDELRRLVLDQLDQGVSGLVVLGLASEAWTLREAERDEVLATVASRSSSGSTARRPSPPIAPAGRSVTERPG